MKSKLKHLAWRATRAAVWALTPHRLPERWARHRARHLVITEDHRKRHLAGVSEPGTGTTTRADAANRIVFVPRDHPTGPIVPAAYNGVYQWGTGPAAYRYLPPQPPRDLTSRIEALSRRPRFSIVVPTYNTELGLLARLRASVEAQWYPHWELIFADDGSPAKQVREYLSSIDDPRVKIVLSPTNLGISGATNLALSLATGDYVVFLDHDDELTEDCLYELACCIERDDADFIYSDEDKIEADGSFSQPFFKPDWSPDALMSSAYTCHVSCVRRKLLDEVGPLRSEFDGSQDWDLTLRIVEQAKRISHVPKILYHWRIIPASAAGDLNAKPYAITAGRAAREAALQRRGLTGELEPVAQLPGYYRVRYDLVGKPLISIIIPSRDNGVILKRCINSIMKLSRYRNFEIILLDNGSADEETLQIQENLANSFGVVVVRHDAPFNFSQLNNIGAARSKGELLLFLNDDTEVVTEDWLERMGGYAQLAHVGAVGAKLIYPKTGLVQHSGVLNLSDGPTHAFLMQPPDAPCYFARNLLEFDWIAVTGACLMIERKKFFAVQQFNEQLPVAYNDVDLCFKLVNLGYFNVVCQAVRLLHHESISRGNDLASAEKHERLNRERRALYVNHPHFLLNDPFYNPNLAPNDVNFNLAS